MRISWNWLSEMVDLSRVGGPQGLGGSSDPSRTRSRGDRTPGSGLRKSRHRANFGARSSSPGGSTEPLQSHDGIGRAARDRLRRAEHESRRQGRARADRRRSSERPEDREEQDSRRGFERDALLGRGAEAQRQVRRDLDSSRGHAARQAARRRFSAATTRF